MLRSHRQVGKFKPSVQCQDHLNYLKIMSGMTGAADYSLRFQMNLEDSYCRQIERNYNPDARHCLVSIKDLVKRLSLLDMVGYGIRGIYLASDHEYTDDSNFGTLLSLHSSPVNGLYLALFKTRTDFYTKEVKTDHVENLDCLVISDQKVFDHPDVIQIFNDMLYQDLVRIKQTLDSRQWMYHLYTAFIRHLKTTA